MASRTAAPVPMECAGGFKALRNHVKLTKDGGGEKKRGSSSPEQNAPRSEREQEWDEAKQLQPLECPNDAHQQQERRNQEERHLHLIRLSHAKEQREIKTRERSVKAMEIALQDAMDRTADKEKSLDQRIQDIARLEQRLHEALAQRSPAAVTEPQRDVVSTNQALEEQQCKLEQQETSLVLREQELAMARDRVADRERHLSTKERVLRDKAVELSHLQAEIEKSDALRAELSAHRLSELEKELQTRYETQERELVERFQLQLTGLTAEFDTKNTEFDARVAAAQIQNQDREARLAERELALHQAEAAVPTAEVRLQCQEEALCEAQREVKASIETAANRASDLETQRIELAERIEDAQVMKRQFEEAEAKLKQQEHKLALFATEVEAQAQYNAAQRLQLEDERAAFASRVVEEAASAPVASNSARETVTVSEVPAPEALPTRQTAKPARTRSFSSGLFRSKSTMRA